ncbi:MAG: hypothetical protein MZU95_14710 [Desulfomicrobium escambiense]|nr:hypothetical protein [Desulfomicrobium escambiense]
MAEPGRPYGDPDHYSIAAPGRATTAASTATSGSRTTPSTWRSRAALNRDVGLAAVQGVGAAPTATRSRRCSSAGFTQFAAGERDEVLESCVPVTRLTLAIRN